MRRGCSGCFGWRGLIGVLLLGVLGWFALDRFLTNLLRTRPESTESMLDDASGTRDLPKLRDGFTLAGYEFAAQGSFSRMVLDGSGPTVLMLLDPNGFGDPQSAIWMATLAVLEVPAGVRMLAVMSSPAVPALLRKPAYAMLEQQRAEMAIPVWLDFGRELGNALLLPKGRVGIALVNADGSVARRFVGASTAERRENVRAFLGAKPLPPPVKAPPSTALDAALAGIERGKRSAIAVVFLGRPVAESDIPHYGGSPLAMLFRGITVPADPSLRLMTFLSDAKGGEHSIEVVAGRLEGYAQKRWIRVTDDAALRREFGVGATEAAICVIDAEQILQVDARGSLPMWRLALAGSMLGYLPPFDVTDQTDGAPADPAAGRGR